MYLYLTLLILIESITPLTPSAVAQLLRGWHTQRKRKRKSKRKCSANQCKSEADASRRKHMLCSQNRQKNTGQAGQTYVAAAIAPCYHAITPYIPTTHTPLVVLSLVKYGRLALSLIYPVFAHSNRPSVFFSILPCQFLCHSTLFYPCLQMLYCGRKGEQTWGFLSAGVSTAEI